MDKDRVIKENFRKEVKEKRDSYSDGQIHEMSLQIYERFINLPEYREAECIYAYMDCKHEVETKDIIERAWTDGKKVAVPKVHGTEMVFYYIESFEDCRKGYFGIREPENKTPANEEEVLMILPGVAFDEKKHRIGYGGGFYDRFLEKHPSYTRIALAFEFQVYKDVPFEAFDMNPEKIITDKRSIL